MNSEIIYYPNEVVGVEGTVRLVDYMPSIDNNRYVVSSGVVLFKAEEPRTYKVLIHDYLDGASKEAYVHTSIMVKEEVANCTVDIGDNVKVFGTVYECRNGELGGRYYEGAGEGVVKGHKDNLHSIVYFEDYGGYDDILTIVPNKYITDSILEDGSPSEPLFVHIMHENEKYNVDYSKLSYGIRINNITRLHKPEEKLPASALRAIENYFRENKKYL